VIVEPDRLVVSIRGSSDVRIAHAAAAPVITPAAAVLTTPQVDLFAEASYEIPTKHLTTGVYTTCGCVISVNLHMLPSAMRGKRSPSWRQRASISIRLLVVGRRVSRGLRLYADELKAKITDPVEESVKL
jgi:hypothetical protein